MQEVQRKSLRNCSQFEQSIGNLTVDHSVGEVMVMRDVAVNIVGNGGVLTAARLSTSSSLCSPTMYEESTRSKEDHPAGKC